MYYKYKKLNILINNKKIKKLSVLKKFDAEKWPIILIYIIN